MRKPFALLLLLLAAPAAAHEFAFTDTRLLIRADGTFAAELVCDLDALALGVDPRTDSAVVAAAVAALSPLELEQALAGLQRLFERRVRVRFDGSPAPFELSAPDHGRPQRDPQAPPSVLGVTARLSGRVPEAAREVTFWASRAFPPVRLAVRDERFGSEARAVLESAEESPPFRLDGAAVRWVTAGRYLRLGFWHILPEGLDHILFVLGLYLLSPRLKPLLIQVSAFTVAHTATLALSSLGMIRLSPGVVEPLIALSIAYVGLENALVRELRARRTLAVFGFGLLHGLGFAGVLGELGLPRQAFVTALVSFNVGVELGQLAVLALAFVALGAFRRRAWYRARVVVPLSLGIAATGLVWTAMRVLEALRL
jgi:hydrogenase/urease accessory protein HupE